MKKIRYLLLMLLCVILCGCSKGDKDVVDNFTKRVENTKSYKVIGTMKLKSNENIYNYDVSVDYKYDNLYKVKLVNQSNSHKQYILKNEESVYVKTHKSMQL